MANTLSFLRYKKVNAWYGSMKFNYSAQFSILNLRETFEEMRASFPVISPRIVGNIGVKKGVMYHRNTEIRVKPISFGINLCMETDNMNKLMLSARIK